MAKYYFICRDVHEHSQANVDFFPSIDVIFLTKPKKKCSGKQKADLANAH